MEVSMTSADTSLPQPRAESMDATDAALFDSLIKEAPIGLAFFDARLRFRRVNETLAGLFGLPTDELVGRLPGEVLAPEVSTAMEGSLHRVLADDRPVLDTDLVVE